MNPLPSGDLSALPVRGRYLLWRPRVVLLLMALAVSGIAFAGFAVTQGSYPTALLRDWLGGRADADSAMILGQLRMPRILLALMSGAMLGLAGAAMQSLTGNALADPGLLGIKEGAVIAILGTTLAVPALAPALKPLVGMLGSMAVMAAVIMLSGRLSGLRFMLMGIGFSWLLSSLITLYMVTGELNHVHSAMIWMAGSLHAASWSGLQIALPWAAFGAVLLFLTIRAASLAETGRTIALGLGTNLRTLAILRLGAVVILTASATAAIGSLGFVGLIAPHLARMLIGPRQGALLSGSALLGGLLTLCADTLGRVLLAPVQIPAGVVVALIGVPFFLALLWRRRNQL